MKVGDWVADKNHGICKLLDFEDHPQFVFIYKAWYPGLSTPVWLHPSMMDRVLDLGLSESDMEIYAASANRVL